MLPSTPQNECPDSGDGVNLRRMMDESFSFRRRRFVETMSTNGGSMRNVRSRSAVSDADRSRSHGCPLASGRRPSFADLADGASHPVDPTSSSVRLLVSRRRSSAALARPERAVAPMANMKALVLNAIRSHSFEGGELVGAGDQSQTCAICCTNCEAGEIVSRLPGCGHMFHSDCVSVWLAKATSCPVCRNDLMEVTVLCRAVGSSSAAADVASSASITAASAVSLPGWQKPSVPNSLARAAGAVAREATDFVYSRGPMIFGDLQDIAANVFSNVNSAMAFEPGPFAQMARVGMTKEYPAGWDHEGGSDLLSTPSVASDSAGSSTLRASSQEAVCEEFPCSSRARNLLLPSARAIAVTGGTAAVGGAGGMVAGSTLGAICGLVPAVFTFGLSVPLGAIVGGGTGFCLGSVCGGAAGLLGSVACSAVASGGTWGGA
eukprot:TRINITY_DN74168_c0_g1_i1.p1 TRINITY_DN74168_c0_g1~~TRINITY_DN74168_c0_g1_i1.p1  ORF type:complete len:435 (-),score=70.56 TRINITY_DN74168_c0_g1_i1:237-1541(-)